MKTILSLSSLVFLLACQSPESTSTQQTYFDLKSFIVKQISVLEQQKPLVRKEVIVNEEAESLVTTKINWAKELDLFNQADLNKPAYTRSYFVDTLSVNTISYRLREGESLPVQFLEVIKDSTGQPRKIKATLLDKNYLFETEQTLTMECQKGKLSAYQIEGFQQLFFGDPKPFKVSVMIQ
ncbi:MAG: hypothetical protein QM669_07220 [Siphonobacter sp.]